MGPDMPEKLEGVEGEAYPPAGDLKTGEGEVREEAGEGGLIGELMCIK